MIALYAQARDWKLEDVRVDVCYDSDATPRRVQIAVHLPESLTHDQVKRLRRIVDTCPAKRALETGFTFEEEFVLADRSPAPAAPLPERRAQNAAPPVGSPAAFQFP